MRKLTSIVLVLALTLAMMFALAACVPQQIVLPDAENPDNIPTESDNVVVSDSLAMLNKIIASFEAEDGVSSFNASIPVRLNGESYSVSLIGNVPASANDSLDMSVKIADTEKTLFGFYITGGKMFAEVFNSAENNSVKVHIKDVDADYLVNLIKKLDIKSITGALDGLLGGLGMTVDSLISMVVPMLFTTVSYKQAPGAEEILMRLDITEILGLVSGVVPMLDSLVQGVMNPDGLGDFVAGIINSIPVFHVDIHSVIKGGKSEVFDVAVITDEEVFGLSANVRFGKDKIDAGIPSDVSAYEPFSIMNLAFNVNLGIWTDGLDVGKLVNNFAPNTLPEGLLVFTADRELTLKVNISLDVDDNAKNLILLELYNGSDTTDASKRMLGAYFIDGSLKINVTDVSNAINIPNIEIKGLPLSLTVKGLIDMLKSTIDGAIDGLFPSTESAAVGSVQSGSTMIVSASVDQSGTAIISPGLTSFVQALAKVFRMDEFVKLEGNALTIDVNGDFFTALETLVPSLAGTLDNFKNFGSARLAVNFSKAGIDDVDLTYRPTNDDINKINVNINSFLIGFKTPNLEKTIRLATANKEYASNIDALLTGALDGIELEGNINLSIKKGAYDIADMLKSLVKLPSLEVAVPQDVELDANLKLQISYDNDAPDDPEKTQGLFELTLNNDFSIFKKGKLIGVYIKGNDLFLEVNGIGDINIPKIKVHTDFMTLLHDELIKLKDKDILDFIINDLINGGKTAGGGEENAVETAYAAVSGGTAMDSLLNIIDLNINETTLNVALTSMALQSLLAKFGTEISLPPIDITASLTDIDDISLKVGAFGFITLSAQITYANIGREVTVELPAINPDDYAGDLQSLISGLLKGVDLQAQLNLNIKKGFDLAEILRQMQLALPVDLSLVFEEDVTLGLRLNLQMAYDSYDPENNKFILEVDLPSDVLFLKKGRLLSIYGTKDGLFVDIAELNGVKIPKVRFNIDIMSMLTELLGSIGGDFNVNVGGTPEPEPAPTAAIAPIADYDNSTILIKQNYIQLYITSTLILELLTELGVINGFVLPEFDLSVDIGDGSDTPGFTGIFVNAAVGSVLTADLSVTEFTAGQPVNIDMPQLNDEYIDSIKGIAEEMLQGVDIAADLNITLHAGEHNLSSIMQLFGVALPDVVITIPNQLTVRASLRLQIAYDANNSNNSKIKLELYLLDDILKFVKGSPDAPFIGVYGFGKNLYMQVNNTIGFDVPKVKAEIDVFGMLMAELEKIDIQELIYGALGGKGEGGNTDTPEPVAIAASDAIEIIVNNDSLKLAATVTAILNLVKALAPDVSIELPDFDLSLEFSGLDNIRINADKMLGAMSLSLDFGIKQIGVPISIEMPNVDDTEYNGNLTELVSDILDGIDLQARLNLTMYKGIYDVSELLSGIISLPPIVLDVREKTVLDITLKLQLKYNPDDVTRSEFLLELILNNDVAFAKAGKLVGLYGKNGFIYGELAPIMDVNIPKVKIDFDIFGLLDKALKDLDINFIVNNAGKSGEAAAVAAVDADNSINAVIDTDTLKIVIAANAFAEIMKLVLGDVVLPPIDITADLASLDGIKITVGVDTYVTVDLSFENVVIGDASVTVDMPPIYDEEYTGDLKNLVKSVLSGVDLEAKAQIRLLPGEHDISNLLSLFGVMAPPILFTVPGTETVTLDVTLLLQLQFNEIDGDIAKFELTIDNDFLIFKGGKKLIGLYAVGGKTYLELSPDGAIDGVNGVKVALGLDLTGELRKIIEEISQDFVIDLGGSVGGNTSDAPAEVGLQTVADGSIGVTLNQESVQIAVTAMAIQQLLFQFGVEVYLPDFDITAGIDSINGITLGANLMGMIGADVALTKTVIGSHVDVIIPNVVGGKEFASDLGALVDNLIKGVEIEGDISLKLTENFDINAIINSLGVPIDMPPISIAIPSEGVTVDARLKIQLKYDELNPSASKALIEIWLNEAPIIFDNESIKTKPFIGVYYENKSVYLELNNVKGLSVPKVKLDFDLIGELKTLIDNMNIDFGDLGFGSGGGEQPSPIAAGRGARADEQINISVKQDTLALAVTLNAIKQLLSSFGLELALPEIDLTVEATIASLRNISLKAGAGVNGKTMLELGLNVTALRFGDETVNIDLSDKLVRDEDGNVIDGAYNSNLQDLLKGVLDGVSLSADFKLQIKRGFDVANFLEGIGVTLPNLDISFDSDIVLDATLDISLKYDANNIENTVGKIEIFVNESVLFINKGLLLGIYIQGNDVYIQVGERYDSSAPDKALGGISGITVPIIKLKTDFMTYLNDLISSLDVDFVISASGGGAVQTAAVDDRGENDLNVSINKDALILKATNIALQQLFDTFGLNLGFILPEFSIYGELTGLDDIKLSVNHNEMVIIGLEFRNLALGDESITVEGIPDFGAVGFSDNIGALIKEILEGVDIEASLNITLKGGKYNIADILKGFGVSIPDIMITVDDDDNAANGYGNIELDATLKMQLSFDTNVTANSRALIELWLNKDIAIAKASTVKPLIGLYAVGDNVYIEINNLENVKIPKIKLKADVVGLIADALNNIGINFDVNLKDLIGGTPSGYAAVSANSVANQDLISESDVSVSLNRETVKLAATAQALSALLANFGLAINWPDIDITAELTNVNGMTAALKVGADAFDLASIDLSIDRMIIGKPVDIDLSGIVDADFNGNLTDIVANLLNGIDIAGEADVTLPAGKYDFSAFLSQFGLSIPTLAINLTKDTPIKSKFVLKTAYDANNSANSRAIIEWVITNPDDVFFIDKQNRRIGEDGKEEAVMIGLYLDGVATYIDLSNIIIANIRLPKAKINANIFDKLTDLLDALGIDFDLNKLLPGTNAPVAQTAYAAVDDSIDIDVSTQAIHLRVTAAVIQLLLAQFGVNVMLPDMDLSADITEITGINVNFRMDFTGNTVGIDLKNIKAKFGESPDIIIPDGLDADAAYGESVSDIVINFINDVDITGQIDIRSAKSVLNVTNIVNAIMATTGQYFDVPININLDNFSNKLYFDMKWHLDKNNPRDSEAAIMLYSAEGKLAVSVYLRNGTLYVDLSGLGFMKFKISNFNFTGLIEGILGKLEPMLVKDLSSMFDDLIAGIAPVADANAKTTPEDMARELKRYNAMQSMIDEAASGEEVLDLLTVIFSTLDITDTLIKLDFGKALIDELVNKAGVYLGVDLYGGVELDFIKGTLNGSATVNEISLGFDFNVHSVGDYGSMKDKIKFLDFSAAQNADGSYPTVDAIPNTSSYTEYSLMSTLDILTSLLGGTPDNFTQDDKLVTLAVVDLYQTSDAGLWVGANDSAFGDTAGYGSGATIRLLIQRVVKYDDFAGGVGSLKIGLYKDYEMTANPLNVALDIPAGRLKVLGTNNLFNVSGIIDGSALNINEAVDVAGLLGGILDPILKEIPDSMYIKDNTLNEAIAPTADITASGGGETAAFNITDYLKSIDLSLFETGSTKVDVALNGSTIDRFLVDTLNNLFMTLDLGSGPVGINYEGTQQGSDAFFDQLWDKLIKPMVSNIAGSFAASIAGVVKPAIKKSICRILPLPRFTDMTVSMTFADSKFKAINVATENSNKPSEILRLNIYPAGQEEVVDWGYISGEVVFDPYSTDKITNEFEGRYASRNVERNGTHRKSQMSLISYGGDYALLKGMDASGDYKPGEYNITATAYGNVTKNIKVTILPKEPIAYIEDVYIQGYGDVPNQVVAVFENGEKRLIKGVVIDSSRLGFEARDHQTTVRLNGIEDPVPVTVKYLDSTIAAYDGEFNIDAYSKNTLSSKLPSRVFFRYGSGYYSSHEVVWDTSALNSLSEQDWVAGGREFTVYATIPDGTGTPQKLSYKVHLRSTEIQFVEFDGENTADTLTVDPYKAIQERDLAVLAEESSVFPSTVTVTYRDGRKEKMPVKWSGMDGYTYTPNGGTTTAQVSNTIGDYVWTHDVTVNVLARTIKYVTFGTDESGAPIKELEINPYKYLAAVKSGADAMSSLLPDTVWAVFEEGDPVEVTCEWSIPDGTVTPAGGYKQVGLTIMPGTAMQSSFKPIINIRKMAIEDVELPKNPDDPTVSQFTFDNAVNVLYGGLTVEEMKPKTLPFRLKTGEVVNLDVDVDFSNISVTSDGGVYEKVAFTLSDGTVYRIDVVIPELKATGTPTNSVSITAEDFAEYGEQALPAVWQVEFNGVVHTVNVSWRLDNLTLSGGTAVMIVGDGSRADLRIPIKVTITSGALQSLAA